MADTTLILYQGCKISKDRNARVDNIESYLLMLNPVFSPLVIQYQKIELNMRLKIVLDQKYAAQPRCNYAKITQDTKNYYFFVNAANWKSTSTVELELELDTVNTFASDFTFNKKTHITRQHKDRLSTVTPFYDTEYEEVAIRTNTEYRISRSIVDSNINRIICDTENLVLREYKADGTLDTAWRGHTFYEQGSTYVLVAGSGLHEHIEHSVTWDDLFQKYAQGKFFTLEYDGDFPEELDTTNFRWWLFDGIRQLVYKRLVDMKPEDINPPQFKIEEYDDVITDNTNVAWNLLYKNDQAYDPEDPNNIDKAIECDLYPSDDMTLTAKINKTSVAGTSLVADRYYYIMPYNISWDDRYTILNFGNRTDLSINKVASGGGVGEKICDILNTKYSGGGRAPAKTQIACWAAFVRDGNNIKVYRYYDNPGTSWRDTKRELVGTYSSIIFNTTQTEVSYYYSSTFYSSWTQIRNNLPNQSHSSFTTTAESTIDLLGIQNYDLTDKTLIKIFEVPYCPVPVSDNVVVLNGFTYITEDKTLKLDNNNIKFENTLLSTYNPLDALKIVYTDTFDIRDLRNDNHESKIFNSEFYTPKFVYDSFNYNYNLENVDVTDLPEENIIKYNVTNTINSRFMFTFDVPLKRSTSDYDNVCIVSRNNERPIFNSQYANYIRNGYNWDVKNKNLNLTKNIASTGLSTLGGIAGGMMMGAMKGSGLSVYGAAIGAVIGLAGGIINTAISQAQADNQIKQKIDEAKNQAISVTGSDDLDLLQNYTNGNKAKYCVYQCSDKVKQTMLDLFFYCGYAEDVRAVPVTNTRTWFNYIQCEPVFNEESTTPYYEFLEDIKRRYSEGVTVYHRQAALEPTVLKPYEYDWDQKYENYETYLITQGE